MSTRPELVRVGKRRQRIHLAPPPEGTAHTLCGKTLDAGEFELIDADPDCTFCVRHQHDPAVVSSAFFAAGAGSALLELSLSAVPRKEGGTPAPAPDPPRPRLRVMAGGRRPEPEPQASEVPGDPEPPFPGLRYFSERVYVSPGRVVVRVDAEGQIAEVVADGVSAHFKTAGGRAVLQAGDVEVTVRDGRVSGRLHPA